MTEAERGRIARPGSQTGHTGWMRWIPALHTVRSYDASWLRHDIVAGLVMTTMLVPVGIAYAEASGLPGINGLYATIVPLLAYAAVRSQPHSGSRTRFGARGRNPGGRPAAFGGRPESCGRRQAE